MIGYGCTDKPVALHRSVCVTGGEGVLTVSVALYVKVSIKSGLASVFADTLLSDL